MTVVMYAAITLLVYFGLTSALAMVAGAYIAKYLELKGGEAFNVGTFFGALFTWLLILLLWRLVTGMPLPLLLVAIAIALLFYRTLDQGLNPLARGGVFGEIWALILNAGCGIFLFGLSWA